MIKLYVPDWLSASSCRRPLFIISYGLFLFLCYSFCHQKKFCSQLPATRLNLLYSLYFHKSYNINPYHKNTPDKIQVNGDYYCDKAPGLLLTTLPVFFLFANIENTTSKISFNESLKLSWTTCSLGIGLPTALGGMAFLSLLMRFLTPFNSILTTSALFLGIFVWPYTTFLGSHAFCLGFTCLGLWSYQKLLDSSNLKWGYLSGGLFAIALSSEYSAGLLIVGFSILVFKNKFGCWHFFTGLFLFPVILLVYNYLFFGTIFIKPYAHQVVFTHHNQGFFGIGTPNVFQFYEMLTGISKGLFIWSPLFLFLIFSSCYLNFKNYFIFIVVPLVHVLVLSGYPMADGGPTISSRFITPSLPFLILGIIPVIQRFQKTSKILIFVCILLGAIGTLIDAIPGQFYDFPLIDLIRLTVLTNDFNPNLFSLIGITPGFGILLFLVLLAMSFLFFYYFSKKICHYPIGDVKLFLKTPCDPDDLSIRIS